MKNKNLIWQVLIGCLVFGALPSQVRAGMTDQSCSACHVMHASDIGSLVVTYVPSPSLLKTDCKGCHSVISGSSIGPAVYDSSNAKADLAGGDFSYSDTLTTIRMGHNPNEISLLDSLAAPPGWNASYEDSAGNQVGPAGSWTEDMLSCAGKFGCHGNHSITDGILSLEKAHHNNSTGAVEPPADASATVGGSYRFLHGIKGYEDTNWQEGVSGVSRNVYYDEARSGVQDIVMNKQTISYLCAQCHGNFHSGTGGLGILDETTGTMFVDPWIRHPVSVDMPITEDYANYTIINDNAPVASATSPVIDPVTHNGNITGKTNRIIMCLSCHRAHASKFYGSMRWDYRGTPGNEPNGCSICHSSKQ